MAKTELTPEQRAVELCKLVLKATDEEARDMVAKVKEGKNLDAYIAQLESRLRKMESDDEQDDSTIDQLASQQEQVQSVASDPAVGDQQPKAEEAPEAVGDFPTANSLMPKSVAESSGVKNVPLPGQPSRRVRNKHASLLGALQRVEIGSTYLSGIASFGDCMVRLLQVCGRTGVREDPKTKTMTPGHNAHLVQPLLDMLTAESNADIDAACELLKAELKDGFDVELNLASIGFDPTVPIARKDEFEVLQIPAGAQVIAPKPLSGKSHRTVFMGQAEGA